MRIKSYLLIVILSLTNLTSLANTDPGIKLIKLIRANYLNINQVSALLNYNLYKGYSNDSIVESYTSEYYRDKGNDYRKIAHTELININDINININHLQKTVLIKNHQALKYFDFDIEQALKFCKNIEVKSVNKKTSLILFLKQGTDIPCKKIEFIIDKKKWIEKVILYYSTMSNFSKSYFESDLDFPKLVIEYQKLDKTWVDKDGILDLENYLKIKKDIIILNPKYEEYDLIDSRR